MPGNVERVKRDLGPEQHGMGLSAGPEIVAHSARAKWANGWAISTTDAVNGFNALRRQAIMDGVAQLWPEAVHMFNTFYGAHSPVLFLYSRGGLHARASHTQQGRLTHGLPTWQHWL